MRRLALGLALVGASFVSAQIVLYRTVERPLDSDGQVVRAVDLAYARRGEDPRFADLPGLPAYGAPGAGPIARASPYPPGLPGLWAPVLAVLPPTEAVVRGTSVAFALLGLLATAALGQVLGGPVAAGVAAAVAAGTPLLGGFAAGASLDVVVGGLVAAAGAALVHARAWSRSGSGLGVGLALVVVLLFKWSGAVVLAPLVAVQAVGVARGSRLAGLGVLALTLGAAGVGLGLVGAVEGRWEPPAWGIAAVVPALTALALAAGARRRDPALARLAVSAALVLGPGLAWYWASVPVLRMYRAAQAAQVGATGLGEAAAWFVPILLAVTPLGLAAAPLAPILARPLGTAAPTLGVVLGLGLTAAGLGASGNGEMFANGSVAGRILLEALPLAAVAVGVGVAGLRARHPRAGGVVAVLVGAVALFGTWSFRLAPCPDPGRSGAVVRTCGGALPRWSPVPARARDLDPLVAALPVPEDWRLTAVLLGPEARRLVDERVFLRGLARRRVVQVELTEAARVDGWWRSRAAAFDEVVLVGLRPPPGVGPAVDLGVRGLPAVLLPAPPPAGSGLPEDPPAK